jgi:glycine/D-amino acid oxidase-like deaminating enzyme
MLQVLLLVRNSALEITRFCISKDLDVDFEASAVYSVATSVRQQREIINTIRDAQYLELPEPELLPLSALHDVFGSARVVAGFRVGGGLLNPFKLSRALAGIVVADGAELYEATSATGISESAAKVCVTTESGRIFCDKAVIATDAFQSWNPLLTTAASYVRSYILVTRQLTTEQLERLNWMRRPGLISSPNPALFARLTWNNRILLGGGFTIPMERPEDGVPYAEQKYAERRLTRTFRYLFPALHDVCPEYVYGGVIAGTQDGLPRFGRLSSRISYAYGYCGHGIISTHIVAKILRDLTLELKSDMLDLPFVPRALRGH